MALNGWVKSKESILLRFLEGAETIKGGQVELLEQYYENGVRKARQITLQDLSILGSSEFSLSGVIATLNSAALTSGNLLQTQVAALTSEKEALQAALAALQAKYDLVAPPITIPMKFVRMALNKLGLASVWGAAVEATITTLELAQDLNPKRVYNWWYDASEVNTEGGEGGLIVVEMCRADAWGDSSLAELVAMAESLQAYTASSPQGVS